MPTDFVGSFYRTRTGKNKNNYSDGLKATYTIYTSEEKQTSTVSLTRHFLDFFVVVVFVVDWRRHGSSPSLLFGAFLRTEREERTSQLSSQPASHYQISRSWIGYWIDWSGLLAAFFLALFVLKCELTCTWLAANRPHKPTTPTHLKPLCPVQTSLGFWALLVLKHFTCPCTLGLLHRTMGFKNSRGPHAHH